MTYSSEETPYHDIAINDPALKRYGFTKFSLPLNGNATMMILHNLNNSKIMYCHFYKSDLDKSVKSFQDKLVAYEDIIVDNITARGLVNCFSKQCQLLKEDQNSIFFKDPNGNSNCKINNKTGSNEQQHHNKQQAEKEKQKRQYTAYKYSSKSRVPLHEAVILAGKPVFLKYESGKIESVDDVEEDIRIIKPPHAEHYPYEPYEFENMEEVLKYRDTVLGENIDSLYLQAKQIAEDHNDQKKEKVNLLARRMIMSRFIT
jgi:hypothetical protein